MEEVLARWGKRRAQAIAGYRRFVQDGLNDGHRDDLYEVVDQRYLGDDAFVEKVAQREAENEAPQIVGIRWAEVGDRFVSSSGYRLVPCFIEAARARLSG